MKKVWVNGTFDILHLGHIRLLEFAKSHGDFLCVGIDSDKRTRLLKGEARPFNNEQARLEFLYSIKFVDKVVIFDSDNDLIARIKDFKPDVFIIGSDYKHKKIIGAEHARQLIFFDRLDEYSSTKLINWNKSRM